MPDVSAVTVFLGANETASWWRAGGADGERVRAGQPVCDVETTKTAIARSRRWGRAARRARGRGGPGRQRSLIGGDLETLRAASSERQARLRPTQARDERRSARRGKAAALARALGIDLAQVAADGVIRERDVLRHHQARTPGQVGGPKPSPR